MIPTTPVAKRTFDHASASRGIIESRHADYLIAAEFDIDKGASISWEYPTDTGTSRATLAEMMLPDGAHQRDYDWTVFFLNQMATERDERDKPLLFVLNLVRTKHDTTQRRGAKCMALAVASRHHFVHIYKPVLILAMEKFLDVSSQDILADVFEAINAMDLSSIPRLSRAERLILRNTDATSSALFRRLDALPSSTEHPEGLAHFVPPDPSGSGALQLISPFSRESNKDAHFHETQIKYDNIRIPVRIPMTFISTTEEITDFSIIKLFSTFAQHSPFPAPHYTPLHTHGATTPAILLLINAVLAHKRVLFVAYGRPSGEVAEYVLALCAIASGCGAVFRGLSERAFPYTCLGNVDHLLKCPGYIAGVTNPFFAEKVNWWDVCCNVVSSKITVSPKIHFKPFRQVPLTGELFDSHLSPMLQNNTDFQHPSLTHTTFTSDKSFQSPEQESPVKSLDVASISSSRLTQASTIGRKFTDRSQRSASAPNISEASANIDDHHDFPPVRMSSLNPAPNPAQAKPPTKRSRAQSEFTQPSQLYRSISFNHSLPHTPTSIEISEPPPPTASSTEEPSKLTASAPWTRTHHTSVPNSTGSLAPSKYHTSAQDLPDPSEPPHHSASSLQVKGSEPATPIFVAAEHFYHQLSNVSIDEPKAPLREPHAAISASSPMLANIDPPKSEKNISRSSTIPNPYSPAAVSSASKTRDKENFDFEFIADVSLAISTHMGETFVRSKFQAYVQRFVAMAATYEAEKYGSTFLALPPPPLRPESFASNLQVSHSNTSIMWKGPGSASSFGSLHSLGLMKGFKSENQLDVAAGIAHIGSPMLPLEANENYSIGLGSPSPQLTAPNGRKRSIPELKLEIARSDMSTAPSPLTNPRSRVDQLAPAKLQTETHAGFGAVWVDQDTKARDLAVHAGLFESWRAESPTYTTYVKDLWSAGIARTISKDGGNFVGLDIEHQLAQLRTLTLSAPAMLRIYKLFIDHIVTQEDITQFLSHLPLTQGGLLPLTAALFHLKKPVRDYARTFLLRLEHHHIGEKYMNSLNGFAKLQLKRASS